MLNIETNPFATPDAFFEAVDTRYDSLSKRLQSIARELHFHRDSIALMNVNDLAAAIDVPPSALVRFAQSMGFSGFAQMKSLFQQNLAEQLSDNNYAERVLHLNKEQQKTVEGIEGGGLVQDVFENHVQHLQGLFSAKLMQELNDAVELLQNGKSIWLIAAGRSFSGASYLTYLMRNSNKPLHWLSGVCFNLKGQMSAIKKRDVLFVISYAPYAEPTTQAMQAAKSKGAKIIAVTDSHLGEVAKTADQVIEVRESSHFGFRSLVNTMCVLQALFLLYASRTDLLSAEEE